MATPELIDSAITLEQETNINRREVSDLTRLLAVALSDDPLQRWLFPNEAQRVRESERLFRRLVTSRMRQRLVSVSRSTSGNLASVAVWTPPTPPAPSRWERLAESLAMRMTHGMRIHEVRAGFSALAARHPHDPYWYLLALATAKEQRGNGHAARLLEAKIVQCDANGKMIALETSLPENLLFYERFGFKVENELQLKNGPIVWLMCRRPL